MQAHATSMLTPPHSPTDFHPSDRSVPTRVRVTSPLCSPPAPQVFSDRDIVSQRPKVEAALAGADVFFGSLLFDYDQVSALSKLGGRERIVKGGRRGLWLEPTYSSSILRQPVVRLRPDQCTLRVGERSAVEEGEGGAVAGADVFFGSLLFYYDWGACVDGDA